jgi:hypothetical protein
MTETIDLKVSYRRGTPHAAYLYLARPAPGLVKSSKRFAQGIVADFDKQGRCIGLEFTAPRLADQETVGRILQEVNPDGLAQAEVGAIVERLTDGGPMDSFERALKELDHLTLQALIDEDRDAARRQSLHEQQQAVARLLERLRGSHAAASRPMLVGEVLAKPEEAVDREGGYLGATVVRAALRIPEGFGGVSYFVPNGGEEPTALELGSGDEGTFIPAANLDPILQSALALQTATLLDRLTKELAA